MASLEAADKCAARLTNALRTLAIRPRARAMAVWNVENSLHGDMLLVVSTGSDQSVASGDRNPSDSGVDNRSVERTAVDAIVKVLNTGREYVFRIRDLSPKGLFLYTMVAAGYPFDVGSELTLELYGHEQSVSCRAVIVRVVEPDSSEAREYPTGFGLRIADIDDDNRAALDEMIARAQASGL